MILSPSGATQCCPKSPLLVPPRQVLGVIPRQLAAQLEFSIPRLREPAGAALADGGRPAGAGPLWDAYPPFRLPAFAASPTRSANHSSRLTALEWDRATATFPPSYPFVVRAHPT